MTPQPVINFDKQHIELLQGIIRDQKTLLHTQAKYFTTTFQTFLDIITAADPLMDLKVPVGPDGYPNLAGCYHAAGLIKGCIDPGHAPISIDLESEEQEVPGMNQFPRGWKIEDAAEIINSQLQWPVKDLKFHYGSETSEVSVAANITRDGRFKILHILALTGYNRDQLSRFFGPVTKTIDWLLSVCSIDFTKDASAQMEIISIIQRIPALVENYNLL